MRNRILTFENQNPLKMKRFTFVFMLIIALFSLGSCIAKCQECEKENANTVTICKDDYENRFDYWNAIQQSELLGYTCDNK